MSTSTTHANRKPPVAADPMAALGRKIRDTGFRFKMHHSTDSTSFEATILITTREAWATMPESRKPEWSSALAGDDLVVATTIRDAIRGETMTGQTDFDPDYAEVLGRLRSRLMAWVDNADWIQSAGLEWGANGQFSLNFETDDDLTISGGRPWLVMDVAPHPSVA